MFDEEENNLRQHFDIPENFRMFYRGMSVDALPDGVEQIEDSEHLDSAEIVELVKEMRAPKGCTVCLFMDEKQNHIILTPTQQQIAGA